MAKRKKKKTRADKEAEVKGTKETAGLAEKKSAAHKPIEAKPRPKPKAKAKTKAKPKTKSKSNIPAVIESSLEQTDKPVDISKEVDIGKPDSEILTENLEAPQTDDQIGDVTEAILDADAEAERLEEDAESLQTEDEQTDIIVEAEAPDTAESLSKETEETRTCKPVDDISGSVVEDTVDAGSLTEEIDDTKTDDLPGDVNEDPDAIERSIEKADDTLADNQAGEVTEEAAESKSIVDRVRKFLSGIFQIGNKADDSTEEGIESHAETESLTEGTGDTHADVQEENVVETAVENPEPVKDFTESADDTMSDKQVGDADEEVVGRPR